MHVNYLENKELHALFLSGGNISSYSDQLHDDKLPVRFCFFLNSKLFDVSGMNSKLKIFQHKAHSM